MKQELAWIGFLATLLIVVTAGIAINREDDRQDQAAIDLRVEAVVAGMDLYAENCAVCHGALGEGLGAVPPLNSEGVREMAYEDIFHTIERGRYNTTMAAYGVAEGGVFTNAEIDSLAAVIQYANWQVVEARVAELGLTPPEPVVVELTDDTLALVRGLPDGSVLADGLQLYVTECAACHGANGDGTTLGPALNSPDLRASLTDADITRTIEQGVPGTLMASWSRALAPQEITNVVTLIRRWEDIDNAGIEMPVVEVPAIDMSPEAVAQGQWLYSLMCSQCHGVDGYGTPLAPALNNQTFLADTPDAAVQQIISLGVSGTAMPAWGGRLTDADIAALAAYIRSWEPTAPAMADPAVSGGTTTGTTTGLGPPWQRN